MRHLTPLLLLLTVIPTTAADDVKASKPGEKSSAAALVEQLGDPDFRTRESAGKKLLDLGERAVSAIEAGLNSPIPEVASRCENLLVAVKHKIDVDAILAPTMVELPAGEQSISTVFDHLFKQSGYRLHVNGDQAVLSNRVKLPDGKIPFWEAVDSVCVATKLEVANVDANPLPADRDRPARVGNVFLGAASGVKRTVVHKAVLMHILPATKDELATYLTTQCPVMVRVFPEPRLKWHRLTETTAVKAAGPKGEIVRPELFPPPVHEILIEDGFRGGRAVRGLRASGLSEATTRGAVVLTADADNPSELGTLSGTVRFTAWKEPAELAVVRLKDGETEGTADGPCGTRLSVKVVGPISNEPGSTILKVVHRWNPEWVRVEQGGAAGDAVWFENVNGQVVPVKPTTSTDRGKPNLAGTVVTNPAGERLTLSAGNTRFDAAAENGHTYTNMTVEYVAKRGNRTDGKPATVTLYAARVVDVSVPFIVKDVPLAPGTATVIERRRYKW